MASTFTTRNKLEKQGFAENSDLWGAPKLNAVFDRIDEAMDGFVVVDADVAPTGTYTVPVRADLIPFYGDTQPGRAFEISLVPDPLSVHRRGIRVTADAPVRVLALPVVEKLWFIIVEGGSQAVVPAEFVYIHNGVAPVMALSPGIWCVFSTADGTLRASNMATVRVDTLIIPAPGVFQINPRNDKQHILVTESVPPLTLEGSVLTPDSAGFLYYPGWSVTFTNASNWDLLLDGLGALGPVEGSLAVFGFTSRRALWTGTKWIVM